MDENTKAQEQVAQAEIKAQELVKKFAGGGWGKNHAITCVNEIIDTAMTGYFLNEQAVAEFQIRMRDYWTLVKTKIEALP
jgi:hypothetical protein